MSGPTWKEVIDEVHELAKKRGHPVTVIAVSKGQGAARISYALLNHAPALRLGESYLEEALEKRKLLSPEDLEKIEWHFLGRLQSRKIEEIAENFSCIHTVARLKELEVLAKLRVSVPKFFLQVNTSFEEQKNGFSPDELEAAIAHCKDLKLESRLLGLMTLPSPIDEVGEKKLREEFKTLRRLRDLLLPGKFLNMGTSGDYKIAIDEGADWIRLGTILFGEREN